MEKGGVRRQAAKGVPLTGRPPRAAASSAARPGTAAGAAAARRARRPQLRLSVQEDAQARRDIYRVWQSVPT